MDSANTTLADALQTKDMAAVAFALRHGFTFAPRSDDDALWLYAEPASGRSALLLFSDPRRVPKGVPAARALTPAELRDGLSTGEIAAVIFDIAGPHPMQAAPDELIRVLDA
jgi:hypothetical protein